MMNKKGFSIFRLILFITLVSLFVLLVSFIFSYINKSNKITTTNKDDLKLITPVDYNPVNDIYSFNLYSYKNSNFTSNSTYSTNIFNYETNTNVYYYAMTPDGDRIVNYSGGYYPISQFVNTDSNRLLVGRDLNTARYLASTLYDWNNNDVRSWSIGYNCNIPVESFNFTMYYNYPLSTTTTTFLYIYTDVGSVRMTLNFTSSNNVYTFSYTPILSSLPSATKILRFGFAIAASSSISSSNYLPVNVSGNTYFSSITADHISRGTNAYTNYFNSLDEVQKDNCCYIAFATSTYPIDYTEGYNNGYNDALNNTNSQINAYSSTIADLQSQVTSLTSTINSQQLVISSLQEQLNASTNNFKGFFFTLADVPFKTIANVLDFQVFGVNLFNFFVGLVTALGLIWLVKKFI